MEKLDRNTRAVTGTMDKYPQESYATVDRVIQPEWKFLQRVKKTTGQAFEGLEKFLQETFLTCILFGRLNPPPSCCRSYKYVDGKEIQYGPTETSDIISREIHQFTMCELQPDWFSHGREGVFNR